MTSILVVHHHSSKIWWLKVWEKVKIGQNQHSNKNSYFKHDIFYLRLLYCIFHYFCCIGGIVILHNLQCGVNQRIIVTKLNIVYARSTVCLQTNYKWQSNINTLKSHIIVYEHWGYNTHTCRQIYNPFFVVLVVDII